MSSDSGDEYVPMEHGDEKDDDEEGTEEDEGEDEERGRKIRCSSTKKYKGDTVSMQKQ